MSRPDTDFDAQDQAEVYDETHIDDEGEGELSLDEADAEPNRFLAYLILALERAGLELGPLSHLAATQSLDAQPLRTLS
ncbi:MAG: hypothetical protein RSG56_04245, partial [Brevundimonas sp.]